MPEKIAIELGNVQETLLLPLWGHAVETQKKKPLLVDNTAVEIIHKINYDFSTIANNISTISQFAWIARSLHIDGIIREFLKRHPKATIVNIGCGLDTTFDRVDNGGLYWYELDLPDVIELRRKFIPENERRKYITGSFLDDLWLKQLKKVIKDGGMDESSFLKWGLESAEDIQSWDSRIKILAEYPMFKGMKRSLKIKKKIGTLMSIF